MFKQLMDRPAFMERYVYKELPPTPRDSRLTGGEASIQTRIIQLERENEALRHLIRSYRSTLDTANDMIRACQQSIQYIRRFRQRQMLTEQNWDDYISNVRNVENSHGSLLISTQGNTCP